MIAQPKIDYLGHTITSTTITPLNEKIDAILKLKEPRTFKPQFLQQTTRPTQPSFV